MDNISASGIIINKINNLVANLMGISINLETKQIYITGLLNSNTTILGAPLVPKRDIFMLETVEPLLCVHECQKNPIYEAICNSYLLLSHGIWDISNW